MTDRSKSLSTETPVALTTAWVEVVPAAQARAVCILYNAGTDIIWISTNSNQVAGNPTPDDPTKYFPIPSGQSLSFEYGCAPRVVRARAASTTATLHIIQG